MKLKTLLSLFSALIIFTTIRAQDCQRIFISEYVAGTGNNKAIEIYNPTSEAVDLTGYVLERWSNGEQSATDALNLEGIIPAFGTWVIANGQTEDIDLGTFISQACDPELQALADQIDNTYPAPTFFNGNDALVLINYGISPPVFDVFGKPGEDPGSGWTGPDGTVVTRDQTLLRKPEVTAGVILTPTVFLPLDEWTLIGLDNWTNLGTHECNCEDQTGTTGFLPPYTNEFDDVSDWTFINEGDQGAWNVLNNQGPNLVDFIGFMQSPSANNGFGEFDGISFLLQGNVERQNSFLELNDVIDCSDLTQVAVRFNQLARAFNFDENYLEVSNDNGISWVSFLVNDELETNEGAIQSDVIVNVSAVAAGQEFVKIRFRWVSDPRAAQPDYTDADMNSFGSGYGWLVDDLLISFPSDACDLSLDFPESLSFCNQESAILNAGDTFISYSWNTGETTSAIEVNASGTYSVQVFDNNGCSAIDSVYVDFLSVNILQEDTYLTLGQSIILEVEVSNPSSQQDSCNDLFISELFVGEGNNKAIEIYNPTSEAIDLAGYVLERWSNGELGATDALDLAGVIPSFGTWLIVNSQTEDIDLGTFISPACDPELQALADQLDNPYPAPTFMNGNDALVLINTNTSPSAVIDIFGKPGEDPGAGWVGPNGTVVTASQTLVRKYEISAGVAVPPASFQPLLEWETIGLENSSNLGFHGNVCAELNGGLNQISYLWSTGDTTPSIEVSPAQNSTFTVTVSNGITTCTDNVTISLLCEVEGGILSVTNPMTEFCVGDNDPNFISVQVSGNFGFGRYGIADANTFDIVGGSNNGTFNFENFPPGDYLIGYVSYNELNFLAGKDNISDFDGCFDVSNLVSISTYALEGGMISTSQATTFCLGPDAPTSVGFSVSNEVGPNFRWALLDQGFTDVILSNQSGSFNIQNLISGVYRIVHVAFGDEITLSQVDPENIEGCVDVSNTLTLVLLDCGGIVNLDIKTNPANYTSAVSFSNSDGGMALLEIYDMSGRVVRSIYNGYADEGVEYQFETDISDLSGGVYLYRLTSDQTVVTKKFIVSR